VTSENHASFFLRAILSSADVIQHRAGKTFVLVQVDDPLFAKLCEWESASEDMEDDDPNGTITP
jgi:hypothetical protein